MEDLKRWYTLREEAMRARREVTTAAQLAYSSLPVGGTDVSLLDVVEGGLEAWNEIPALNERVESARTELDETAAELGEKLTGVRTDVDAAEQAITETKQKVAANEQQITEMLVDLDTAMEDAAAAQVEAVLARGLLTVSASAPVAADGQGKPLGAMWMHRTGTALTALYEWTSLGWVPRPLSETIIPKIAIGSGTYGEMEGSRLIAKTVGAEKLIVGDFQNYWQDPEFRHPAGYAPWQVEGLGVEKNGTGTQSGGYFDNSEIYVQPGERFKFILTKTHVTGATSDLSIFARRRTAAGEQSGANTRVFRATGGDGDYTSEWTVPAGVERLSFGFWTESSTSSSVRVRISNVRIYKMGTGELLVDGAVGARHVATGTLQALAATITEAWIQSGHIVNLDVGKLVASSAALSSAVIEKLWADVVKAKLLTVTEKVITKDIIATGAIDGMMITGATIRTAANGQRLELNVNGLRAFNASNAVTASLKSASGGFDLTGYIRSGIGGPDPFEVYIEPGYLRSQGADKLIAGGLQYLGTSEAEITRGEATFSFNGNHELAGSLSRSTKVTPSGVESDAYLNSAGGISAPFAISGGIVTQRSVAASGVANVTVTFPVGRFTVPPRVSVTVFGDARDTTATVDSVTAESCVVRLGSMSVVARTIGAHWTAVQMTPTSANG